MTKVIEAILVYNNAKDNEIFDLNSNRDGIKDGWIALKQRFMLAGINLITPDLATTIPVFKLYLDFPSCFPDNTLPSYLIQFETSEVYPFNAKLAFPNNFKKVFTWDDSLIGHRNFVKCQLGHRLRVPKVDGFSKRTIFCSMIASNKCLPKASINDLYLERQKLISWFQENAINDFSLYGNGWGLPYRKPDLVNKIFIKILERMPLNLLTSKTTSWKGAVETKAEVLSKSRFNIAYENVSDLSGYITEKIFDAFSNGCVPVYWGASNIEKYIPASCFIDRRKFKNNQALYQYLKGMDEKTYCTYQQSTADFMKSEKAKIFGKDAFANTIVENIMADLRKGEVS